MCFIASLALAACVQTDTNHLSSDYLTSFANPNPTLTEFPVCHGFGCAIVSRGYLSREDWRQVAAIFKPTPKNAQAERQRIAHAIALMQILIGEKTGTAAHQWTHRNLIVLPNFGDPTQFDCIDEAVNTWTYLTLMDRDGLFYFHQVAPLSHVGVLPDFNVRNTAVIQEKGGDYFAVDPSLVDHGVPPPVMPLTTWLAPWPPNISVNKERITRNAS